MSNEMSLVLLSLEAEGVHYQQTHKTHSCRKRELQH